MKKTIIAIVVLTVLMFTCLVSIHDTKSDGFSEPVLNGQVLENGDVIFRKGRGIFSELFCSVGPDKSLYSHDMKKILPIILVCIGFILGGCGSTDSPASTEARFYEFLAGKL